MRNMMVFEEADGTLIVGSITHAQQGKKGWTIWYGYVYRDQPYYGHLTFDPSTGKGDWQDAAVLTTNMPLAKGKHIKGQAHFASTAGGNVQGPVVLDGWWEEPAGNRLSWLLRFEVP